MTTKWIVVPMKTNGEEYADYPDIVSSREEAYESIRIQQEHYPGKSAVWEIYQAVLVDVLQSYPL